MPDETVVTEVAAEVPAPKKKKSTANPTCPCCLAQGVERSDGVAGFECPECESVYLGTGSGITITNGVISNLSEAKNLSEELASVKDSVTITGPFRGNAQLFQITGTLPTMAGVVKASKGFTVERFPETIFLTRSN